MSPSPPPALLRVHHWLSDPPPGLSTADVDVYALTNYTMVMGFLAHGAFIPIFLALHVWVPALFNVVSVTTFLSGLALSKRGHVTPSLLMASAEVVGHAWVATWYVGWVSGFHFYMVLAIVICFLFTQIPIALRFVLSGCQTLAYVALALYGTSHLPLTPLAPRIAEGLTVMNIVVTLLVLIGMLNYYAFAVLSARLQLRAQNDRLEAALGQLHLAQAQIVAQQKLAHLGTLTAGIAHEIKNPLNFVNNFSLLSLDAVGDMREALTRLEKDPSNGHVAELRDAMEILEINARKVCEHGGRADRVVQSMLLHAGASSGEAEPTDLNALVLQSTELARSGSHGDLNMLVRVETDLDTTLPPVRIAPRDVARALLNVIGNAVRAAGERARQEPGFDPLVSVSTRYQAPMAVIRVRDNGRGIAPELQERIFTPFFTTQPTGEGTGLGLSISHDIIVGQHKGRLHIDSKPGEYAEFVIELPV